MGCIHNVNLNDDELRLELEAGYVRKTLILAVFYSKIKANDGTTSGGSVDPGALNANEKIDFLDISSGVLLYSDQAWFGCFLKHLNKPNIAFIADGNVPLDMF
jgi:hypothetical protein